MKTKIKRHYRSVVSVLLSVCMLVSCMTVGLIATDAAKVTDSDNVAAAATGEAVGAKVDDADSVGGSGVEIKGSRSGEMYKHTNGDFFYNVDNTDSNFNSWYFEISGTKYAANTSSESDRDIFGYNSGKTVKSGSSDDFRWKGSGTSFTIWLNAAKNWTWVTSGTTALPTITLTLDASAISGYSSTATVTGTTTISASSGTTSGSYTIDSTATITVAPLSASSKKPTASLGGESVDLSFDGTNYVGTFEIPDSDKTLTIGTKDKGTYTVSTAVNDASYGTANIVSVDGSAVTPTTSVASVLEDTAIGLQATSASSDHPFASWNKGTNKTAASTTYYVNADDADTSGGTTITVTAQFKTNYYDIRSKAIVGDTTNIISLDARLFDYYYDSEYKSNWLGMSGSEKDTPEPYTIFNRSLREYAEKNGVQVPLYFGTLYGKYDGYTGATTPADLTPASLNSMDYRFYWAANDSNGINALGSVNGNDDPLTGLSGLTLADGTIHHFSSSDETNQNGVPMALFDKDWLTSRSTGAYSSDNDLYSFGGPLATIIDTKFPVVKEKIDATVDKFCLDVNGKWTLSSDNVFGWVYADGKAGHWVQAYKDGDYYYIDREEGYDRVNWVHSSSASVGGSGTNWTDITNPQNEINPGAVNEKDHSVCRLSAATSGAWTTDSNSKAALTGGHAYYGYNSLNGEDNAYFTGIHGDAIDPVMNYKSGANDSWSIKDDKNAYSFLPFDSNHHGSNGVDYGFGMNMSVDFTLGAYDDGGTTKYGKNEDGTDQIFEFSGDDDLWVFVDGKLVLDLGGAHGRTNGEINFRTLTVSTWDQSNNSTPVAMSNAGGTSGLPPVTAVTRNFSPFTLENKSKHTLTIYYMERGQLESNLKFGFTFEPVGNELQLHNDISTENVNTALAAEVETLATANDTFSFNESWSETVNGKFAPISGKAYTFTHDSKEGTGTTDNTGTVPNGVTVDGSTYSTFSIGDNASFVDQYKDEIGHYVKLVETFGESNIYSYSKALSVLDLVTSNNRSLETGHDDIFEFDTTKANPNRDFDATRLKATYTNSVLTKSVTITKAVAETDVDNPDFTVKVCVKLPGGFMKAYQLVSTSGTLNPNGTFTFKAGGSNTISGIPVGATVEVTEVSLPQDYSMTGWTVTCTGASTLNINTSAHTFVIPSDGADTVTVALTNTKATGKNVKIYKTLTSGTSEQTYTMFIKTVSTLDDASPVDYSGTYKICSASDDSVVGTHTYDTSAGVSITTAQYILLENVSTSTKLEVTEKVLSSAYVRAFHYAYTKVGIGSAEQAQVTATSGANPIAVDNGVRFSVTDDTIVNVYNKPWTYFVKYQYPAYLARYHDGAPDQWYDLTGAFTDADFDTDGAMTIGTQGGKVCPVFKDDATKKAAFVSGRAPYQDNFMTTLTWALTFGDGGNTTVSYAPTDDTKNVSVTTTADAVENKNIQVYFKLPYDFKRWVENEETSLDPIPGDDGKILKKEGTYYRVNTEYEKWVTKNRSQDPEEAQWVEAPEEIYDSSGNKFVFRHWEMKSVGKNLLTNVSEPGDGARTHAKKDEYEYKRCYNTKLNMTFYQDSYVEPVYISADDPDASLAPAQREAKDTGVTLYGGAIINFLENSRNQWNDGGGTLYGADYENKTGRVTQGDRVFSDFLFSFNYNDIKLRSALGKYKTETVEENGETVTRRVFVPYLYNGNQIHFSYGFALEAVEGSYVDGETKTKTQEEYRTQYNSLKTASDPEAKTQMDAAIAYINGGSNSNFLLKEEYSAAALDNKNEIEYSNSIPVNNVNHRENKVYRAFAYLRDYNLTGAVIDQFTWDGQEITADEFAAITGTTHNGSILEISAPVYFTIRDMASVVPGMPYNDKGGQS